MRVLFWYCERFEWQPTLRTLDEAPEAQAGGARDAVVAFVHVEPADGSAAETKLVKNTKWLARKWDTRRVVLHSFSHLGEEKADPEAARATPARQRMRSWSSIETRAGCPNAFAKRAISFCWSVNISVFVNIDAIRVLAATASDESTR